MNSEIIDPCEGCGKPHPFFVLLPCFSCCYFCAVNREIMASNYQEFVTEVKLNSEQARNKLQQLRKETEEWIKKRDDLISAKGSKTQINNLTKLIQKNERAMAQLEKQAHNIIDTIDHLDGANLIQLQQAEKTLNAEMRKTPQNTEYFHELTEKLQQVKTQIAAIRLYISILGFKVISWST